MNDDLNFSASRKCCVYTVLLGDYEDLNEQPQALETDIPFICFTDNPKLRSDTWKIRIVEPAFPMDPIRSQRDLKIRPHVHLPDFDTSVYIDNSVLLTASPDSLLQDYPIQSGLRLPLHSFRSTVVEEFLAVAISGFDDQGRIFEQLNHYQVCCPEALEERPYWTAILIRDHHNDKVRKAMDVWAAHVFRYSRRDQLSINLALREAKLSPDVFQIDNLKSNFHVWPNVNGRDRNRGVRAPLRSFSPPIAQVALLKQELKELQHECDVLRTRLSEFNENKEQAVRDIINEISLTHQQTIDELSSGHARELQTLHLKTQTKIQDLLRKIAETDESLDLVINSNSYRVARRLSSISTRFPRVTNAAWKVVRLAWWICTFQAHRRVPKSLRNRRQNKFRVKQSGQYTAEQFSEVTANNGRVIYVDPSDERGVQLINSKGDFNPNSLRMWKRIANLGKWTIVIDVGANYGEMLINQDFHKSTSVIAIEPNPRILPYLTKTLRQSRISCTILPCAVTNYLGITTLLMDQTWSGTTRIATGNDAELDPRYKLVEVPTTTLTQIITTHAKIHPIRVLLKIDVEGQEIPALDGLTGLLNSFEAFAALIEILHLADSDITWIFQRFDVYLFDPQSDTFIHAPDCDPKDFRAFIDKGGYYPQDVCITRKGDNGLLGLASAH